MESDAQAPSTGPLSRALVFSSVVFGAWVYAAASTVPNAVLPQMQGDLSASLDQISWVVTAAVVASAIGIPPTPWLAARFGLKTVLSASLVLFCISSVMIGVSATLGEVLMWRIAQALFGAPILALSQTVTLDAYGGRSRGTAMAIWSISLTTGWVFAPVIGAWVADLHNWRWIFFGLAPLGLVAVLLCMVFVPRSDRDARMRFDWFGFVALSVGLTGAQLVLNRGERLDWFDSPEILLWAAFGAAGIYLYVAHTMTSDRPFLRWSVLRDRNVSVGLAITAVFAFVSLAPLILVPTMMEALRGSDVVTNGLLLVPRGVVQILVMLMLGPFVTRLDPRVLIGLGFVIYAAGSWMMASYNLDIGVWDLVIPMSLHGIAVALIWLPTFNLLYLTLAPGLRTDCASLIGLTYNVFSSIGVAAVVTLLGRSAQISNEELSAHVGPHNELFRFPEYAPWDLDALESMASVQAEIWQQALMIGYVNTYWVLTVLSIAVLPLLALVGGKARAKA